MAVVNANAAGWGVLATLALVMALNHLIAPANNEPRWLSIVLGGVFLVIAGFYVREAWRSRTPPNH